LEKSILLVEANAQFTEIFKQAVRQVLAPERLDVVFVEAIKRLTGAGRSEA
jgi:hypothetical protein